MSEAERNVQPSPVDAKAVPENTTGREPDFLWEGQPRYQCRVGCGFDTYNIHEITRHEAMHSRMGQTGVTGAPPVNVLFNHLNQPIKFD